MKRTKIISIVLYSLATMITLSMASKFLMATEYFAYHSEASGIGWEEIPLGLQVVFMAVFKLCGAGFLSIGLALAILTAVPYAAYNHRWSYYAIPVCGLVFWSITLAMTLFVKLSTQANTPWMGSSMVISLLVAGFAFSLVEHKSALSG